MQSERASNGIPVRLRNIFFIILFVWISFFPQPLQDKYSLYTKIFLAIFLLLFIIDRNYRKNLFSLKDWPLWLFLLSLSGGISAAVNKNIALTTYAYLAINLIFLFYIGKGLYCDKEKRGIVNMVICISSGLVALFGLLETALAFNPLYAYFIDNPYYERYISYPVRPMSTQLNPGPLATYLLLTLPFAIYILKEKGRIKRFLGSSVIVLNITCLILTFCRGTFLGLVAMLFFYQWVKKKYKIFQISLLIFIILLVLFSCLPYPFMRLSPLGIGIYGTGIFSDYRITRTIMSWQMFKGHPFFGVGLNHFRILFDNYYPAKADLQYIPYEIKIADNMHLTLMSEAGAVGLAGFFIFIFSLFKRGLREKSFILVAGLAGFLLSMGGYELFYWVSPYMLFCLISGFIYDHQINA